MIAADSFVHHFGSRSFVDGKIDYSDELRKKHEIFRKKWDLPAADEHDQTINLAALAYLGFVPPLHFQPLPSTAHIPLWDWEKEKWLNQGEDFFQVGRLDAAQRIFRQILNFHPTDNRAASNLACTLWQLADPVNGMPEAVQILEEVLKRDPENEDAKWNLEEMKPALTEI